MGGSEKTAPARRSARPVAFVVAGTIMLFLYITTLHATSELAIPNPVVPTEATEELADVLRNVADFLDAFSTQHNLESLKGLSNDIRAHSSSPGKSSLIPGAANALASRGLLPSNIRRSAIGDFFSGLESSASNALSGAVSGIGTSLIADLAGPAQYLGDGLGRGSVAGLNATSKDAVTPKLNGTNLVAENLGFGLTNSLISSVNVTSLLGNTSTNSTTFSDAAGALGAGLGGGTTSGLALNSTPQAFVNRTGVSAIAANFGNGLTSSVFGSVDLMKLMSKVTASTSMSMTNLTAMLGPAALGFGSGLGQGAVVGLNLQQASSAPPRTDVQGIVHSFSQALVSNFLANGTLGQLKDKASTLLATPDNSTNGSSAALTLPSINIAQAAQGFARGLVSGAGDSINNAGGIKAVFAGTANKSAEIPTNPPAFNDSLSGGAVGFAYGLSSQSATLVMGVMGNSFSSLLAGNDTPVDGNLSTVSTDASTMRLARRLTAVRTGLYTRTTDAASIVNSLNTSALNISQIESIIQTGADSLSCEGIGGFVQVLFGLYLSGTISIPTNFTLSNTTLPNTTLTIDGSGNNYVIDLGQKSITVNGAPVVRFAIVLVLHIVLMIAVYYIAIPAALVFKHGRAIAILVDRPDRWLNASRWGFLTWGLVVVPISIIGFSLGVGVMGSAKHFATPHGIVGLIAILMTLAAGAFEMPMAKNLRKPRAVNLAVLIFLSAILFLTGLADLGRVSFCATNVIPGALQALFALWVLLGLTVSASVVAVRMILAKWLGDGFMAVSGEARSPGDGMIASEKPAAYDTVAYVGYNHAQIATPSYNDVKVPPPM